MLVLAGVALAALGFATFGDKLYAGSSKPRAAWPQRPADRGAVKAREAASEGTARPPAPAADQTTLANLPASRGAAEESSPSSSAPSAVAATAPSAERLAEASSEAAPDKRGEVAGAESNADEDTPVDDPNATPESQLAANAGRHVIAGRYAEALPLYEELQQGSPQKTAYRAMVNVLKQKLGLPATPAAAPAAEGATP
jgi:hypothetical protein